MLGIILFILKVLGIIVLCALGLIFLILLLVLFAPIRYSSEGSKYVDNLQVKALVTYLNPIVRVKISYPDEAIVKVRILGITVFPVKLKERRSDGQREEKAKETREQRLADEASETIDRMEKRVSESNFEDRTDSGTGEGTEKPENQKPKTSEDKQEQDRSKRPERCLQQGRDYGWNDIAWESTSWGKCGKYLPNAQMQGFFLHLRNNQ